MNRNQKKFPARLSLCLVLCLALLCGTAAAAVPPVLYSSGSVTIDGTETLTGTSRLYRDGAASSAGTVKAFPGTFGSDTYYFEVEEILPPSLSDYDMQITVTETEPGGNLFCAAYTDSFDPADLSANYLGDAGSSSIADPVTFSFTVPAGKSVLLVFMNSIPIYTPETSAGTNDYEVTLLSLPTYAVTVENAAGGSAEADATGPAFGDTVTLTATPLVSYVHTGWEVVSPSGLIITGNTFEMPAESVTVRPTFEELPLDFLTLTGPHKTTYDEGEALSLAGLVVTAHYRDGSSRTVAGYSVSLSEGALLTPAHNTVTVTYLEDGITKTASFDITVFPKEEIPESSDAGMMLLPMVGSAAVLLLTAVKKNRQNKNAR